MLEQSICNRLQADQIMLEWVAFSVTKSGLKLNIDNLEQFEHEVSNCLLFCTQIQDIIVKLTYG